jgi:hypothetical protein
MDKTETSKQRLLEFLKYERIGQNTFEDKVGISRGHISQLKEISNKLANRIAVAYPNLNIDWLKRGEAEMIKSYSQNIGKAKDSIITQGDSNNIHSDNFSESFQKIILNFQEQQKQLLDIITNLTQKI